MLQNQNQVIGNRYQLEAKIGEGGMGTVFRGRDNQTGEPVAIKVLTAEIGEDDYQETLMRFRREAEVLYKLNHPNIVKMLDAVEEGGRQYIIMELVTGGSLAEWMRRQHPLPVEQIVAIALEVSDALARAHHLHIIHRDIKPGNVLLSADHTPRVTDFGVAHISGQSRVTSTGQVIGTLSYISPELLRNAPPDARSDIWAFGVLLFELLTGTRPFDRNHTVATIQSILTERPPDLEALRPNAPVALVDLIYRMLDKTVERRISSMRLVGAELEAIKKGLDVSPLAIARLEGSYDPELLQAASPYMAPTRPVYRLPAQSTPFVGREQEIADVIALLQTSGIRLVTILGPGGMGKTRLALRVAEAMVEKFPHGACFVPLAPIDTPERLVTVIAEALHLSFVERVAPHQQLIDYLHDKALLLIVDNFEHLIEGAGLIAEIQEQARAVQVLATSRTRLNLQAETVYTIGGMALTREGHEHETLTVETALTLPAIELFVQSARRSNLKFELLPPALPWVFRICELVQGMPLAIELAAAWVEMLSVEEIAREIENSLDFLETDLRDVPERHRSLRAVFDYSWQLMTDEERTLFKHLAVFQGGFTRDAAQQVAGASLRNLSALVNKSLMRRHADGRYEVHEVLRQYAGDQLTADEWQVLQDRHAACYAALLARSEKDLKGGRQTEAALIIEQEIQNVRAAWQYAVQTANFEAINQSLESLNRFYDMATRFEDGETAFRGAAEHLRLYVKTPQQWLVLGRLLARQGWFARRLKTADEARQITQESLEILQNLGARAETAFPLNTLGCIARDERNHQEAIQFISASLEIYRETGDQWGIGFTLYALGDSARIMGEFEIATHYFEESIEVCKAIGDHNGVAWAEIGLAAIAMHQRDFQVARTHLQASLDYAQRMGFHAWVLIEALQRLGWLEWRYLKHYGDAQRQLERAHKIILNYGTRHQLAESHGDLALVYASLNQFTEAVAHFRDGLVVATAIQATDTVLKIVVGLASVQALSSIASANRLREAVEWLAFARHHPQTRAEIVTLADDSLEMLRLAMPAAQFEQTVQAGKALQLETIVPKLIASLEAK